MRRAIVMIALGLFCAPAWAQLSDEDRAARAAITVIRPAKIILVGDSTMQVNSGYGGAFCAYHVDAATACLDLARGGRSTYSFRAEGLWDIALDEMKTTRRDKVYVLIQMGHNDQPGKPGRSTDLVAEYPQNLRNYVLEARAVGAIPVLVTPLTRREFKDGLLVDDLGPWAEAVRQVAKELNVPLVDLYARSRDYVQALGPVASMDLAQLPPTQAQIEAAMTGTSPQKSEPPATPSVPEGAAKGVRKLGFDNTHLGPKGAEAFASLFAESLAQAVPELASSLIK